MDPVAENSSDQNQDLSVTTVFSYNEEESSIDYRSNSCAKEEGVGFSSEELVVVELDRYPDAAIEPMFREEGAAHSKSESRKKEIIEEDEGESDEKSANYSKRTLLFLCLAAGLILFCGWSYIIMSILLAPSIYLVIPIVLAGLAIIAAILAFVNALKLNKEKEGVGEYILTYFGLIGSWIMVGSALGIALGAVLDYVFFGW